MADATGALHIRSDTSLETMEALSFIFFGSFIAVLVLVSKTSPRFTSLMVITGLISDLSACAY